MATSIVINDGQATPVSHTFSPQDKDMKNVFWFEELASGPALGNKRVSVSLARPPMMSQGQSSANRVSRCKLGIYIPTLELVSPNAAGYTPAPTVAYNDKVMIEFTMSERGAEPGRDDLIAYAIGVLNDPQVVAAVTKLQTIRN